MHFVSASAGGPCSMCGQPSTHKVGEEIASDEPCMLCGSTWYQARHPGEAPSQTDPAFSCGDSYHRFGGPIAQRHNLTAYVCCEHFTMILGGATGCPLPVEADADEDDAPSPQTVKAYGKEWLVLTQVLASEVAAGYCAVECHENGRAKMPADVKYIEVKT